ncbi:lyase family protein [Pelistega indica]|nr:lyase family protein [Pelistega indica]
MPLLFHTGRSRQDMYSTYRMAKLRNQSLDYAETLLKLRASILNLASQHIHTIVPAYTNGVQAMPQSYAHYLLAFNASFARDQERFISLYQRMNKASMGTAVLANSSWPLNRQRLANLLGFDGPIENSYDASQIAPSDIAFEASNLPASTAIRLGMLLNDIHTQYHQVKPWILLDESSTYTSSAMPQKRNPGVIMRARESASNVLGLVQAVSIRNHNVTPGMTDYKSAWDDLNLFPETMKMLGNTLVVIKALKINPERALEELENDWTTSMELAETLQKDFSIPFRVGHHFASSIVTEARNNGWKPSEFPFEKAKELYIEAIEKFKLSSPELPLSEKAFRQTLSPKYMVETRVGLGGPQAIEVERMLKEAKDKLSADIQWIQQTRQKLNASDKNLEQAFNSLMQ